MNSKDILLQYIIIEYYYYTVFIKSANANKNAILVQWDCG